jgi:hypothetical protein
MIHILFVKVEAHAMTKIITKIRKFIEKSQNIFLPAMSAASDRKTRLDLDKVAFASQALQISEFRLFCLAYSQWYGCDIPESELEYIFSEYMFEGIVPHWARHFARQVITRFEQGMLDPGEFNIECPKATEALRSAGFGYSVILTVILIVFCVMLTGQI